MKKLNELFCGIEDSRLILPDFQRDYKWSIEKQRNLLASIILKFPIGSLLFLNGSSNDYASRRIGELEQVSFNDDYPCKYLLDGQQRTTTLFNAFNNVFDVEAFYGDIFNSDINNKESVYQNCRRELSGIIANKASSLKVRWFLKVPVIGQSSENVTDIFGAKELDFELQSLEHFDPEDLVEILVEKTFNEKNNKNVRQWYSPFYELDYAREGNSRPKFQAKFIQSCKEEGLIPLYWCGKAYKKSNIIRRILTDIAKSNGEYLKETYRSNFEYIKSTFDRDALLDSYQSEKDIIDAGDNYDELLDEIFNQLQNGWVNTVHKYLIDNIYDSYELPSIETDDIKRAIPIFCHLNEGGMALDDFDLLSARAAKKIQGDTLTYSLSKVVRGIFNNDIYFDNDKYLMLTGFDSVDNGLPTSYIKKAILAICSQLAYAKNSDFFSSNQNKLTKDKSNSRALLKLSTEDIRDNIEIATHAVLRAFSFLVTRCGVTNAKKLHYTLMIQPIAFVFTDDTLWKSEKVLNKVEYWYWASLFGGSYIYDQSAKVIEDMNLLYLWVTEKCTNPFEDRANKIFAVDEYSCRDFLLMEGEGVPGESILSAVLQYILSLRPFDLSTGVKRVEPFESNQVGNATALSLIAANAINDHHLIPVSICKTLGQTSDAIRDNHKHILNSPLNRVFISADSNNKISSLDPTRYFELLGKGVHSDEILKSQLIPDSFKNVGTNSITENNIKDVLTARFDLIKNNLSTELLQLVS